MKTIRLLSGEFENKAESQDTEASVDRKVMLVYCGQFESMDGPVEIKEGHIDLLAKNHNDFMAKLAGLAGKDIPLKNCPPIQLDHSVSARDTVGRLVGALEIGEHEGKKALFGTMRVMGKENVERVKDGRWTNVSIGADLESGKLTELSITPFPAAPDAAMLSRLKRYSYKGFNYEAKENEKGKWESFVDGDYVGGPFNSEKEALEDAEEWIEEQSKESLSARMALSVKEGDAVQVVGGGKDEGKKGTVVEVDGEYAIIKIKGGFEQRIHIGYLDRLSQGENMYEKLKAFLMGKKKLASEAADAEMAKMSDEDKAKMAAEAEEEEKKSLAAKCKKHLMEHQKMSDEDAEKKLAEMDDESKKKMAGDYDAEMSRMAEEAKKEGEAKMAANKAKAIELSAGIKLKQDKVKLAQRRATITSRLSKYRAMAKITPAEIKQYSLEELSKKSDEAIETLFESLEKRQPVILAGAFGSMSEVDVAKISAERKKVELKKQVLGAMSFTSSVLKNTQKLSEGEQEGSPDTVNIHVDTDPHTDMEGEIAEIERMMDTDVAKAKEMLREKMKKYMNRPAASMANEYAEPAEKELKELASEVEKMHTDLEQLTTLIGEMAK